VKISRMLHRPSSKRHDFSAEHRKLLISRGAISLALLNSENGDGLIASHHRGEIHEEIIVDGFDPGCS
jgi:hypothetical protein